MLDNVVARTKLAPFPVDLDQDFAQVAWQFWLRVLQGARTRLEGGVLRRK